MGMGLRGVGQHSCWGPEVDALKLGLLRALCVRRKGKAEEL